MAWRPTRYLIEGELYNIERRKVTGWMQFQGLEDQVTFDLEGEFHRDIRGAGLYFYGDGDYATDNREAKTYMKHFALRQTGQVGDITAGLPPHDYASYPYIEWYSEQNGRVVLELKCEQIAVIGTPIPACESDPVSREEQQNNMTDFLYRAWGGLRSQSDSDNHRREPPAIRPGDQPPNE